MVVDGVAMLYRRARSSAGYTGKRGCRKHRKVLIVVGSGNGKTPLVAGTALYCASQDGARNPEIDVFANSAGNRRAYLVGDCAAMVSENKALQSRFKVLKHGTGILRGGGWQGRGPAARCPTARSATFPPTRARSTALRPTLAVFDELHEMRTYKLLTQMQRSLLKSRRTAAFDDDSTMGTVLDGVLVSEYRLADERLKGLGDPAGERAVPALHL